VNYARHYAALVARAASRDIGGYTEVHHVVPRCLGGEDDKSNRVALTAREHYTAHLLLVKMNPLVPALIYAAHMMTVDRHGHRIGNRKYEWLRKRHAAATSDAKRGNSYTLGRKHSEHAKARISAANKGNQNCLGRVLSPESLAKLSRSSRKPKTLAARESMSRAPRAGKPYSCGSEHVHGITQRKKNGAFVVRKWNGCERVYVGFFWDLAEAKLALGN
jgi:hypothetical protein